MGDRFFLPDSVHENSFFTEKCTAVHEGHVVFLNQHDGTGDYVVHEFPIVSERVDCVAFFQKHYVFFIFKQMVWPYEE